MPRTKPDPTFLKIFNITGRVASYASIISTVAIAKTIIIALTAHTQANLIGGLLAQDPQLVQASAYRMMLIIIFRSFLTGGGDYLQRIWATTMVANVRHSVTDRLLHCKPSAMASFKRSDIVSRTSSDINLITGLLQESLPQLVLGITAFIGAAAYMLYHNHILALAAMGGIPVLIGLSRIIGKPIGALSHSVQQAVASVNAVAKDALSGLDTVKTFNLYCRMKELFTRQQSTWIRQALRLNARLCALMIVGFALSISPFVIVFGVGGYLVSIQSAQIATLFAFIELIGCLGFPLREMPQLWGQIKTAGAGVDRIIELTDLPLEPATGTAYKWDNETPLRIDQLTVTYPGLEKPVFEKLSFSLASGDRLLIAGPSGCGKSSLIRVLTGELVAEKGVIIIGGQELTDWNPDTLRSYISIATHDSCLFPLTIAENIRLGKPAATYDDIVGSAISAQAHEFITALPKGYNTNIGELGSKLSGGQRQRIALARAFIKQSPLMLFDEATSALDYETENTIINHLTELPTDTTIIWVTHRQLPDQLFTRKLAFKHEAVALT